MSGCLTINNCVSLFGHGYENAHEFPRGDEIHRMVTNEKGPEDYRTRTWHSVLSDELT